MVVNNSTNDQQDKTTTFHLETLDTKKTSNGVSLDGYLDPGLGRDVLVLP